MAWLQKREKVTVVQVGGCHKLRVVVALVTLFQKSFWEFSAALIEYVAAAAPAPASCGRS